MEQLCNKCGKLKDISEFETRKDIKSGYSKICKECRKVQAKERYNNMTEDQYIKTKVNSLNNSSGRSGKAKEIIKSSTKITVDSIKNLYQQQNKCCYYCKTPLYWKDIVFDHVKPLSRNGEHCIDNIRICCKDCNDLKDNRTESEFLKFIFIYIQRFANPELIADLNDLQQCNA